MCRLTYRAKERLPKRYRQISLNWLTLPPENSLTWQQRGLRDYKRSSRHQRQPNSRWRHRPLCQISSYWGTINSNCLHQKPGQYISLLSLRQNELQRRYLPTSGHQRRESPFCSLGTIPRSLGEYMWRPHFCNLLLGPIVESSICKLAISSVHARCSLLGI